MGDMSADTAMTRKGFGEMAVTATMAGPIFNILMGQGLASLATLLPRGSSILDAHIPYSIWAKDDDGNTVFNKVAVLPLTLLTAEFAILSILLFNALKNDFRISFRFSFMAACFYVSFTIALIVYSITAQISTTS